MIKTLRESKAKLSELVERASRGEDVLITVRGRVKARLTRAAPAVGDSDMSAWADRLERLQERHSTGRRHLSVVEIVARDRGD